MKKPILFLTLLASFAQAQTPDPKMQWFADAKLGIFIHWGIFSPSEVEASWPFWQKKMPYDAYLAGRNGFTASRYQPEEWAKLFKRAGARYVVLTSKHHDGVALWDTKQNDLSIPNQTPARRDVLTPLMRAVEREGMKKGLYFSILDWSHPDYPIFTKDEKRYEPAQEPVRWASFVRFYQAQLGELQRLVNPDLWWFDGQWEQDAAAWRAAETRKQLLNFNPNAIINSRLRDHGDYSTPEQGLPLARPQKDFWELCMTMNSTWGYTRDPDYKSPYQLLMTFAEVIGNGGNLLLNVGPKADGTLPDEQVKLLEELGRWTTKHAKGIYATVAGLPGGYFYGPSTIARDSSALYLFVPAKTTAEQLLKGIDSPVKEIRVLGSGQKLSFREVPRREISLGAPPVVYFRIPEAAQDALLTVIEVIPEGHLRISRSRGHE